MNRQKILISQIKNVTDIKSRNLKGIESSKQKIFGYLKNMPGETNWVKPLMGKSLQNYYFPSKYLHLDFNLKEYLRMQTVRFNKKNIDDSFIKLQKCINLIIENKKIIDEFFSHITEELLHENQSLKDFYQLYLTIYPQKKSQSFQFNDVNINSQNKHFSWFYSNNGNYGTASLTSTSSNIYNENKRSHYTSEDDTSEQIHKRSDTISKASEPNTSINNNIDYTQTHKNYKNIIFERTNQCIQFKKIVFKERDDGVNIVRRKEDKRDELEEANVEDKDPKLTETQMKKEEGKKKQENSGKTKDVDKPMKPDSTDLHGEFLKDDNKIYYLYGDVNLGLGEPLQNIEKEKLTEVEKEKEEAKALFYQMMNENKNLQKTLSIRNRFVDPLYLRRRYSYIDKLTKKKIKKEKKKMYRKHFIQSADEKKIWPDNKGLLNKKYPNPYS